MDTLLIRPIITEKTMHKTLSSWFTFKADVFSRKEQLIHEIESIYKVNVLVIRTAVMKGKMRRVGRKGKAVRGADWKKVTVQLKQGQTIDAFQIGGPEETK